MKAFTRILIFITCLLGIAQISPYLHWGNEASISTLKSVDQRVTVIGYDRAQAFGSWKPGVREKTIERAGTIDPYSGDNLDAAPAEVDHIFPLSAAWDLGAYHWPAEKREQFANDQDNLVLVSRKENQAKGDQLPHEWLPSRSASRCWYVRRLSMVAATYDLPLPKDDIATSHRQCGLANLL